MINLLILGLGLTLVGYLIGSFSSAVIVAKLWRLPDPRTVGSKNPGATNILRLGGKLPALLTLLGDALKGFIPVYFAKLYLSTLFIPKILLLFSFNMINYTQWIISAVFLAVVLGHLYPVFFQFKGGKGVATALGGLFALKMGLGLSFIAIWLIVAILTRYSALSALVASAFIPVLAYGGMAPQYTIIVSIVSLLIFWHHRVNIQNLIQGTESKIGARN